MRQKKYSKPEGYLAPTGAEELLDRYRAGERFFERAQLQEAQLERCQLEKVNLCRADLSGVNARRALFFGVDFADATCDGMWLDHAQLFQCSFANVDLRGVSLYGTQVAFVSFFGTKVDGAPFLETLAARDEDKARLMLSSSQGESCFVSYANADRFPSEVEQSLRRADIVNWFMPRSSWFNSSLSENLARAIGLCDVFVFILSDNALSSRWVLDEVKSALRLRNKTGQPRIVMLRTDGTQLPATGPFSTLDAHEIDCSDRTQGLEELVGLLTTSAQP